MALAASCALAACSAAPQAELVAMPPAQADTDLRRLIVSSNELIVVGERLDVALLKRFYARRDYEPVWASRQTQVNLLANAVLRAGDQGLDPELFHADLLRRRDTLPPMGRELLVSAALLSYADALGHGAVRQDRRNDNESLTPDPMDAAAALDAAIDAPDPVTAIERLAPQTPTYRALRQALLRQRAGARPNDAAAANRLRTIEVNLERQRWLPRTLPADRVWVNVADQNLVLYRADQPVFSTRVVVGEEGDRSQSPEFRALIEASFYNPPWVIPADIVSEEILPRIDRDPEYLTRNNMILRPNGEIEQQAGPNAGLGYIMFDMPNRFDVYLHDTPNRAVFSRVNRRISHGCIRVQNPREFAALLMQQPLDAIDEGIAMGGTTRNSLPVPVPVFVIYQTAFLDAGGTLQFRPDFYNRDAGVWRRLREGVRERTSPMPAESLAASSSST